MRANITRRGALCALATVAAAPAIALPAAADTAFALIDTHRKATAAHGAALGKQTAYGESPELDAICEAACHEDMRAWRELVETAPQTLPGFKAWVAYLNEVEQAESWMVEDAGPAIIKTLALAIQCA